MISRFHIIRQIFILTLSRVGLNIIIRVRRVHHKAGVISKALGTIRFMQHPDKAQLVLVDGVHQLRMLLPK